MVYRLTQNVRLCTNYTDVTQLMQQTQQNIVSAVAHPRGRLRHAPPLRTKIFLISCSFGENLANLYVGGPLGLGAPSYGESCIRPCSELWWGKAPSLFNCQNVAKLFSVVVHMQIW